MADMYLVWGKYTGKTSCFDSLIWKLTVKTLMGKKKKKTYFRSWTLSGESFPGHIQYWRLNKHFTFCISCFWVRIFNPSWIEKGNREFLHQHIMCRNVLHKVQCSPVGETRDRHSWSVACFWVKLHSTMHMSYFVAIGSYAPVTHRWEI